MHKNVLIIYTTAGIGHKKAAYAIKEAFCNISNSNLSIDIIDALDYTNPFFRYFYPRIYIFLVNRIPLIWGLGYYLLDNKIFYSLVSWFRHLLNWINGRKLIEYLRKRNYGVIITTHFFPADVISMAGKNKINAYLINVITDYRAHSFWIAKGIDLYIVGHNDTRTDLIERYGILEKKIKVLGIPVSPVFAIHKERKVLCEKFMLNEDLFTVLIGSGGFGVGPILELVRSFSKISVPIQLLVVCGKNKTLYKKIENIQNELHIPLFLFGFVDYMDELMDVSDVIITKAGGLMSSEALSKCLPIIAVASIPGQETRNIDVLKRCGVLLRANSIKEIPEVITGLYKDKTLLRNLKRNIELTRKPQAAEDIVNLVLGLRDG